MGAGERGVGVLPSPFLRWSDWRCGVLVSGVSVSVSRWWGCRWVVWCDED